MNKFLSVISIIISSIALAISGWNVNQSSQLRSSIEQQKDSLTKQQDTIAEQQQEITQLSREIETSKTLQQANSVATSSNQQNTAIQPGQFVKQGFDNKVKIELLSVKRIQNPDGKEKNVVVVKTKIRRIVPKGEVDSISLSQSRGRNSETSEVYRTITNKSTNFTYINDLPEDSWGNAYFWLKVPEEVNVIDIIIPKTAIFEQVPIAS